MKITVIKKSEGTVKSAILAACPWVLDDPASPKK